MIINVTPRLWTNRNQYGLRFRDAAVQSMAPLLTMPCRRGRYPSLQAFLSHANAGVHPATYSRRIIVSDLQENQLLSRFATFSYLGNGTQGNITAPGGTWFEAWVKQRLNLPVRIAYHVLQVCDFVILL